MATFNLGKEKPEVEAAKPDNAEFKIGDKVGIPLFGDQTPVLVIDSWVEYEDEEDVSNDCRCIYLDKDGSPHEIILSLAILEHLSE